MDCLTFHYDPARTGVGDGEPKSATWAWRNTVNLGAPVHGAPLVVRNWTFRRGPRAGATVDLVIVATSDNRVFAFSEDDLFNGLDTPLWPAASLGSPVELDTSNIPPPIGVCSTGVLDPANSRFFVISAQADADQGRAQYIVYSLDLDTGATIQNAALADPGGQGRPTFISAAQDQRAGLNLVNGRLYAGFAAFWYDDRNDYGPYYGWVVSCDANNLLDQWYWSVCSTVQGGGIWGPGGIAAAPDGTLYVATGNATEMPGNYWTALPTGKPPAAIGDYFIGVAKLGVTSVGWGGGLSVLGSYQPSDIIDQQANDQDFGSSSPLILPDIGGRQLLVLSTKKGIYLLDRHLSMAEWGTELWSAEGVFPGESHSAPAYWQTPAGDHYVYFSGGGGPGVVCYRVDASSGGAKLTEIWRAAGTGVATSVAASSPTVGSYPTPETALVWLLATTSSPAKGVNHGHLMAFDALDGTLVFDSDASGSDPNLGLVVSYAPVTCAGRSILVGTAAGIAVYGAGGSAEDCSSGGPYPSHDLGTLDGKGSADEVFDGDCVVERVADGFNLTLQSRHGNITINTKVDQHSSADLNACGTVEIGQKIDQHSVATIVANKNVTIGQKIDQHSAAAITSVRGGVSIGQKIDQHSSATITADGDITIGQAIDQHSAADITSRNGNITITEAVDQHSEATLRAPNGTITIGKVAGGAAVRWHAQKFICPDVSGGTVTQF